MDDDSYNLVLDFDANDPETYEKVHNCLMRLSPDTKEKLDRFLVHGKVILKRKADPKKDRHIVELLRHTGGVCRFEKALQSNAKKSNSTPGPKIICPQCQRSQTLSLACCYCGVIIEKAQKLRQVQLQAKTSPAVPVAVSIPLLTTPRKTFRDRGLDGVRRIWTWMQYDRFEKAKIQRWSQRLGDALMRCAIVFVIALILEIGWLYLGAWMWFIYTSTPVGQYYLSAANPIAESIAAIAQMDLTALGWQASLTAFYLCLFAGAIGQFCHLIRYFHEPFGFSAKGLLWGLPLSAAAAWVLSREATVIRFSIAYVIVFVPTLVMMNRCFCLAQAVIPELGTLVREAGHTMGGIHRAYNILKKWTDGWSPF